MRSMRKHAVFLTAALFSTTSIAAEPPTVAGATPVAGVVQTATARLAIEFRVVWGSGVLFVSDADGKQLGTQFVYIDSPDMALRILADPRYSFLWAGLTQWAGDDLGKLRDRYRSAAREAMETGVPRDPRNTAESSTGPRLRATLQYASVLAETGDIETARTLLLAQLPGMDLTSDDRVSDWVLVRIRLAQLLWKSGRGPEALEMLSAVPDQVRQSVYRLNIDVNRAALLAESGRYAEALEAIQTSQDSFQSYKKAKGQHGSKVGGSARHFDWIRACALHGLGRGDEAQAIIGTLETSRPSSSGFVVEADAGVKMRAYACMQDGVRYTDQILADFARKSALVGSALIVQPAFDWPSVSAITLKETHEEPRIKALFPERVRILPLSYLPALNHWQKD
jgi:hypothetical protein